MNYTYKITLELPLKYASILGLLAIREKKDLYKMLADIIINNKIVKKEKKYFDSLPPEPEDGDFGLRPRPDSPLNKYLEKKKLPSTSGIGDRGQVKK